MPKAKPVSLHPLNFEEAIKALMAVEQNRIPTIAKRTKTKPKRKQRSQ
jgi:hypothetical protein